MAPVTHPDRYGESIDFWQNVNGINMSAMLPLAKQCAFEEPSVESISGENVLTWPHVVKHEDFYTIAIDELESVTTRYKFRSMMRAPLHGFAFWFNVEFGWPAASPIIPQASVLPTAPSSNPSMDGSKRKKRTNQNEALVLSTAPEDPPTHWQNTLIYSYDPIDVEQDQLIEGSATITQSKENL
ncbi:probable protein arginine N-methyltransferase 6 isoform X3 [Populus trichocarpa]|nr:probable protein arginine N-methyltransferase 6 isoform X3 [Populus trichocarpa]|eukprot:XP_024440899.1 probable protein arginine N-methyltransferase 6 isoform X3 [Populus trichocarpa]